MNLLYGLQIRNKSSFVLYNIIAIGQIHQKNKIAIAHPDIRFRILGYSFSLKENVVITLCAFSMVGLLGNIILEKNQSTISVTKVVSP